MKTLITLSILCIVLMTWKTANVVRDKYDTPLTGSTHMWIGHDGVTFQPGDQSSTIKFYTSDPKGGFTAVCTIDSKGKRSKGCTCALPDYAKMFCGAI